MKMRWLLALGLVLIFSPAHASSEFTDAEAKRFLEHWYNTSCLRSIYLGNVILQAGEKDHDYPEEIRKRYDYSGEYVSHTSAMITSYMYAMEERGIIEIERLWVDPSGKWQDSRVTLTRKGEALRKQAPQGDEDEHRVCVKLGTAGVKQVVRNEEVRKGLDVFRIVMAIYEMKWTPEHRLLVEMWHGRTPSENRKVIALLKYDPFQSKWEMVTSDAANLDEEFETNKVTTELERR